MGDGGPATEVFEDLQLAVQALGEYRRKIVLVGGLVPFFYRHLWGDGEEQGFLATSDIDMVTPNLLPISGNRRLGQKLEEAGFFLQFRQGDVPPSAKFHHERHGSQENATVTLEFITDRRGGAREGQKKRQVQEGFFVPALPYVKILTDRSVAVDLSQIDEFTIEGPLELLVPHPANYVFHKMLVAERRSDPSKKYKDWANVFETAILTRQIRAEMNERLTKTNFHHTWFKKLRQNAKKRFSEVSDDGPVGVTQIFAGAGYEISETGVHRQMKQFFVELGVMEGDR